MCMTVGVPQLICHRIQEQITSFVIQIDNQILEDVHVRAMNDGRHIWCQILRSNIGNEKSLNYLK